MKKLLKSPKNSYIFLETLFALVILSIIVSGVFKFTLTRNASILTSQIYPIFHLNPSSNLLNKVSEEITFKKDENGTLIIPVVTHTYQNSTLKLKYYAP